MKRLAPFFLLLVTLASGCAHRAEAPARAVTPSPAAPLSTLPPRQAMWSVQGPKGKVVLLGSMHALREPARLRPEVSQALARAKRVVFESDFTNPTALQQQVVGRGTFADGQSLSRVLSPATLASLDQALRPHGMTAAHLEQFEPWMVSFVVASVQLVGAGAKAEHGVEHLLHAQSVAPGKPVLWLEQTPAMLGALDAMPLSDQEVYLEATLREPEQMPARLDQLARAWHTGDLATLDVLLNEFREQSPLMHERLLTDRNRSWVPGVEGFLNSEGETLVVVGAGHLVGADSVVELLRARGYAVQAL